ncbi:mitofusin [Phlyctochytrium bullatum]|nr:mitofusin [Phlyctochytrium bullatum]
MDADEGKGFDAKRKQLLSLIQEGKAILEALKGRPGDQAFLYYPVAEGDLEILSLGLTGNNLSANLVEEQLLGQLLTNKIVESQHYLDKLHARISDIRSRVLVTGDLNAGKSTFVNALLRREVVPDDQQPCTALFCEVVDVQQNQGVEEVHGIRDHTAYQRTDPSTYAVLDIATLRETVEDNVDGFELLKVYCQDSRPQAESLLHNGVVDISLIDSPGLNIDSEKTTLLFSQQEEIDVIVFVVNAANHFTLSGRQFLKTAGKEKAYIFIVVNRFDSIRRKDKCKADILEQIKDISPLTYESKDHLIHFVSARKTLLGEATDEEGEDFKKLEQNLRTFILEKRARSKLAPAKIYLLNLLNDVERLCDSSFEYSHKRIETISRDLTDNAPSFQGMVRIKEEFLDDIDRIIDSTGEKAESYARNELSQCMASLEAIVEDYEWMGILGVWQYTRTLRNSVYKMAAIRLRRSEENAKATALSCLKQIQDLSHSCMEAPPVINLGVVNSAFEDGSKEAGRAAAAAVFVPLELNDFFEMSEKVELFKAYAPSIGMTAGGLVIYTRLSDTAMRGPLGWLKAASLALSLAGFGLFCYVLSDMKHIVDKTVIVKLKRHFENSGFLESNPARIGKGTRRVLKMAIWDFQTQFLRILSEEEKRRESQGILRQQAEISKDIYRGLKARAATMHRMLSDINVEEK